MKKLIKTTILSKAKFLFGSLEDYAVIYRQIKQLLPEETLLYFAEPQLTADRSSIGWYTNLTRGEITNFKSLEINEQLLVRNQLQESIQQFTESANEFNKQSFVEKVVRYKGEEHLYVYKEEGYIKRIILTQWAMEYDALDDRSGDLKITEPPTKGPVRFKVIYDDGSIGSHITFSFTFGNATIQKKSGNDGVILLDTLMFGTRIRAFQLVNDVPINIHKVLHENSAQEHILKIKKTGRIQFQLIDTNDFPIPNTSIYFEYLNRVKKLVSNEQGYFYFEDIPLKTTVEAYQLEKEEKIHHQNYYCNDAKKVYKIILPISPITVILLDRKKWFGKNRNKKNPIPNADMSFDYNSKTITGKTDEKGRLVLNNVSIGEEVKAKVITPEKYETAFLRKAKQDEYEIQLPRRRIWLFWLLGLLLLLLLGFLFIPRCLTFTVLDTESKKSIEKAKVSFLDDNIIDTTFTNVKGKAKFCGVVSYKRSRLVQVSANCDCYESTEKEEELSFFLKKKNRTIFLSKKRSDLTLKVVSRTNNAPLNKAKVTIVGIDTVFYSNSNGEVFLANIPICAKITVRGNRNGYEPDSLKEVEVRSLLKIPLDSAARHLRLKAKEQIIEILVKSKKTKIPIPNAKVYLYTEGLLTDSVWTNENGIADFANLPIDATIELRAYQRGYYDKDNSLTGKVEEIGRRSGNGRTIWLTPIERSIVIRVIDKDTKTPISGADAILRYGGVKLKGRTNRRGEVEFAEVKDLAKISVIAKKRQYKTDSIVGIINDLLENPNLRVIELEPIPKPCDHPSKSGGREDSKIEYDVGRSNHRFFVEYDMASVPDEMIIYCGKKENISPSNIIWQTGGEVSGVKRVEIRSSCNSSVVTVRVIGNRSGTSWSYALECPK